MENGSIKEYLSLFTKENIEPTRYTDHEEVLFILEDMAYLILEEGIHIGLLDNRLNFVSLFGKDDKGIKNISINRGFDINEFVDDEYISQKDLGIERISIMVSKELKIGEGKGFRLLLLGIDNDDNKLKTILNRLIQVLDRQVKYHGKIKNKYNQLINFLDFVDEGISSCDKDGVVNYINKSGMDMFGIKEEDVIGKKIEDLNPNFILKKVLESKNTYQDVEYSIDLKNKNIHLMTSAYPVYDADNELVGAIDVFKRIKRSIKSASELMGHGAYHTFEDFVGTSSSLNNAIKLSKRFAHSDKNILITGESGTGKELFAQSIHNHSIRKDNPFVAINCASYPKELFDSELFGYEDGAFTGAKKGGKTGKFELADGGTLFLDEIGEMPINLQAKLLRVLETRRLTRIGSNKNLDIDVRIIAATNRNLEDMIKINLFREDLYFRLKVLYLHIDSLKNRGDDVIVLSNHFIKKFSLDNPKPLKGLEEGACKLVKSYKWPGNIRQLENIISLAMFYSSGEYITRENLISAGLREENMINQTLEGASITLYEGAREIILRALEKNNGNKSKTAEELGISRSTIYRLLNNGK